MSQEHNQLDGSLESDYNSDSDSSGDEMEDEQLGHCPRSCFPLLVSEEMCRCSSDGLHLIVRTLGEGNEGEDIATIVQLYAQRDFFIQTERHCSVMDCQQGLHVGTLMTDGDSKLFCVHCIAAWVYVLENLDYEIWS